MSEPLLAVAGLDAYYGTAHVLQGVSFEMGAEPVTQPKLSVTASSLPAETTTVLLESRGKQP